MDDADLAAITDEGPHPADPDALRAIVERHRRARVRGLSVALGLAVVAGPAAGWAVGHSGTRSGERLTAASSPDAAQPSRTAAEAAAQAAAAQAGAAGGVGAPSVPGAVVAGGGPVMTPSTHLFTRTTADGVVIRAYIPTAPQGDCVKGVPLPAGGVGSTSQARTTTGAGVITSGGATTTGPADVPPPVPAPPPVATVPMCVPVCAVAGVPVVAEISTDAAIAFGSDFFGGGPAPVAPTGLSNGGQGIFGVGEGAPVEWVIARTGSGIVTVRLTLPGGSSDQMAPAQGWVVLAAPTSASAGPIGVVEALEKSGKAVATYDLAKVADQLPSAVATCGAVSAAPAPASSATGRP